MKQSKISPDHESMNLRFKISSNMFEPFTYNPKIGWSMMVVVIIPVLSRINTIPHLLADAPSVAVSMVLSASQSSIPEDLLGGKCVEIYGSSIIFHPVSRRKTNLWVTAFRQYTQHVHTRACIVIYLHNYMSVCMCVFYQCIITYTSAYALFIVRAWRTLKLKYYIIIYDYMIESVYIAPLTAVAPQEAALDSEGSGTFGSWSFSSAYREQRALCDDCAALSYVSWTTSDAVSAERNFWMTNCKSLLSNHWMLITRYKY